jgi:predicted PurR-regulated permease PerM
MPAKVYLVLSLLGMAFTLFAGYSFFVFAINIVFTFLWAWVLNWLCNKGYSSISWLLVLLPFFLFMLSYLFMFSVTLYNNSKTTTTKMPTVFPTVLPKVLPTVLPKVLPTVLPTAH